MKIQKLSKLTAEQLNSYKSNKNIIRKKESKTKVLVCSDADLDGIHIGALLAGFIEKYKPELKGSFGRLNTPVKATLKNGKLTSWTYDIQAELVSRNGETQKYFKGLGSWNKDTLSQVIEKDGFENMIEIYDFDDPEILKDFLSSDESDKRKEYIRNHEFSIADL